MRRRVHPWDNGDRINECVAKVAVLGGAPVGGGAERATLAVGISTSALGGGGYLLCCSMIKCSAEDRAAAEANSFIFFLTAGRHSSSSSSLLFLRLRLLLRNSSSRYSLYNVASRAPRPHFLIKG
jgi:hypothetical protein